MPKLIDSCGETLGRAKGGSMFDQIAVGLGIVCTVSAFICYIVAAAQSSGSHDDLVVRWQNYTQSGIQFPNFEILVNNHIGVRKLDFDSYNCKFMGQKLKTQKCAKGQAVDPSQCFQVNADQLVATTDNPSITCTITTRSTQKFLCSELRFEFVPPKETTGITSNTWFPCNASTIWIQPGGIFYDSQYVETVWTSLAEVSQGPDHGNNAFPAKTNNYVVTIAMNGFWVPQYTYAEAASPILVFSALGSMLVTFWMFHTCLMDLIGLVVPRGSGGSGESYQAF